MKTILIYSGVSVLPELLLVEGDQRHVNGKVTGEDSDDLGLDELVQAQPLQLTSEEAIEHIKQGAYVAVCGTIL